MSQSNSSPRRGPGGGRRSSHSARPASKQNSSIAPLHPTLEPPDIKTFSEWTLGDALQGVIAGMGITVPTPIQRLAIQPVLDGRDVIAKAETGTGKTLAFGAPMMAKIDPARASVLGLVLCPTRELAEQVQKVLAALGAARGVKTALVVGGEPLEPQVNALKGGAQVVVGTPGRILDLYKQRFLSFPWTEFAILDEADVMLEIGFIDDVKLILSYTPDERQTLLFSATFPPELLKLAREYTKNPVEVATASGVSTVDTIEQSWIHVEEDDRSLTLIRLIEQSEKDDVFLVFCDRRTEVDKLMRRLERLPFSIKALHGGYDQAARFRVMSAFRTGEVKVLVATDVASRGLDVAHVTHVVNYTSPHDITEYTHRIGRTGRAGRKGKAITLVGGIDRRRWNPILHDATWKIPEEEAPRSSQGNRGRAPERFDRPRDERPAAPDRRADRTERPSRARDDRARDEARPIAPDNRRAWPVDEEAPRRDERAPRRRAASDPVERRGDRPAPVARPAASWPADEDARDEAARDRNVRPQRESPLPARAGSGSRAHADSRAPDLQRETTRPRRSPPPERATSHERKPREPISHEPASRDPRGAHARGSAPQTRASAARNGDPREHAARSRGARPSPARHEGERAAETRRPAPRREEAREKSGSDAAPRADAKAATRPEARPRARSAPPSSASSDARARPPARAEARDQARPPRRTDHGRAAPRPPAVEERPPGTFERPMSGGLLGHAARRASPPPPPRGRDDRHRGPRGRPERRS